MRLASFVGLCVLFVSDQLCCWGRFFVRLTDLVFQLLGLKIPGMLIRVVSRCWMVWQD